ncbi:hypothetical protein SFUMM280S_02621 [Streptomyces fumanus]
MTPALVWRKSSYSGNDEPDCVEVATTWVKSSYSSNDGPECVEVARTWVKSSHSSNDGPDCVEVALSTPTVHIRDSKDTDLPHPPRHPLN